MATYGDRVGTPQGPMGTPCGPMDMGCVVQVCVGAAKCDMHCVVQVCDGAVSSTVTHGDPMGTHGGRKIVFYRCMAQTTTTTRISTQIQSSTT